ncbi:hypothetical protein EL22_25335 [Halostagnicola sp. A56]|uniref:hypothetical protein n=1 Tax=Halostagnicola sp. A56 TaxID=1495067 RepID=UPI0004A009B2|nr:hypothetical protein [Halostagnicola sp. A56]KDE56696.1 hypothetical protein EL22_25335 [Halostagnicola sp. A56]
MSDRGVNVYLLGFLGIPVILVVPGVVRNSGTIEQDPNLISMVWYQLEVIGSAVPETIAFYYSIGGYAAVVIVVILFFVWSFFFALPMLDGPRFR